MYSSLGSGKPISTKAKRLVDSPCSLVTPKDGMTAQMEKDEIAGVAYNTKAKADLKYHTTLYVETPGFWGGFYGKAGGIMTLVQTEENLSGTGSSTYPNETILGAVAGIGFKRYMGNLVTKLEGTYTAYETINISCRNDTETTNTAGCGKITADPQALGLSFSVGYAF